ncbi:helix-turn-helix domain-containing protein [Streptomyces sp. NPDC057197]
MGSAQARLEAGRANPALRTLSRIARAIGVPLHELAG